MAQMTIHFVGRFKQHSKVVLSAGARCAKLLNHLHTFS